MSDDLNELDRFLDEVFLGRDRVTADEMQRRAVEAGLTAALQTRIDALPEGEYALDEVTEALHADAA